MSVISTSRSPAGTLAAQAIRTAASCLTGVYAVYALEALRDRSVTGLGWAGIAAILGMIACGEAWAERTRWRTRLLVEGASLLAAFIIVAGVPGWAAPWLQRVDAIVAARSLAWLLGLVTKLSAGPEEAQWQDRARVFLLFALTAGSLLVYLTPDLVGPIDARWYGNAMIEFLAQFRAGTFPVLSGETIYAFNGAVHPFRSAPWQFDLAALVDLATLRTLAPVAVQHVTIVASFVGAVLVLYAGLARFRPGARWTAWLLAGAYATSPAITGALVLHDMYMILTAAPFLIAVFLAVARAIERPSFRNYAWVGAGCAALWLCHPPTALLGMLVAAFCLFGNLAVHGLAPRALAAAAFGAVVFALLAAPYFFSMLEVSPGDSGHPGTDILLPAIGLWLLAAALAQTLRRDDPRWLLLVPLAWLCLNASKPTLLPFAGIVAALGGALAFAGRGFAWRVLRRQPEPLLLAVAIGAAIAADAWFPRHDVPNGSTVMNYLSMGAQDTGRFFRPVFDRASEEPGTAIWLLLALGFGLIWSARAAFSSLALAAAGILVVGLGIVPHASQLLWLNSPPEFISIIEVAYALRLLPVLVPLTLVAIFPLLADLSAWRRHARLALFFAVLLLVPWSLWEHAWMLREATGFKLSRETTASYYRPENIVLERYTWDLLPTPFFFSNGVMDPRMECRFWPPGRRSRALIDPDSIARAMEVPNQPPTEFTATADPLGPTWLYLAPKIELRPGEHKLLRFDFMGREITGWMIVKGGTMYREYIMPSSGRELSFGFQAPHSAVLSIFNSGTQPEFVELTVKREGPDATAPLPPGPFMRIWVSDYDEARAPIAIVGWSPLRLRVQAPANGAFETFRNFYPGYSVTVDGHAVIPYSSFDGLLDVPLRKGPHDVVVRFTGTPALRAAVRWGFTGWILAGLALGCDLFVALRRRSLPSPPEC